MRWVPLAVLSVALAAVLTAWPVEASRALLALSCVALGLRLVPIAGPCVGAVVALLGVRFGLVPFASEPVIEGASIVCAVLAYGAAVVVRGPATP